MRGNYKHGMSRIREYHIWTQIKSRCYNKNNKRYKDYGGRGIKLYEQWAEDPLSFIDYIKSLDHYGGDKYSLDRINNDGNYEPKNLRWINKHLQKCNSRNYKNKEYSCIYKLPDRWIAKIGINNKKITIG